ncbi:hypothetical protein G6F24_016468 [Rhizopus arrhizus]|nr:hypothetical protein G6F24_016468 [Rhizopus arrhizus]
MMLPAAIAGTITKPWIAPLVRRYGYDTFLLVNTVLVGASIVSFAAISPGWPLALQRDLEGVEQAGCRQWEQPVFDDPDAGHRVGRDDRRWAGRYVLGRGQRIIGACVHAELRVRGRDHAFVGLGVPTVGYVAARASRIHTA